MLKIQKDIALKWVINLKFKWLVIYFNFNFKDNDDFGISVLLKEINLTQFLILTDN